jgi:hypothetical protein
MVLSGYVLQIRAGARNRAGESLFLPAPNGEIHARPVPAGHGIPTDAFERIQPCAFLSGSSACIADTGVALVCAETVK